MAESYSVEARLSAVDNGFTSAMSGATKSLKGIDDGSKSATKSIGSIVTGLGAFKLLGSVFNSITNSMDAAINRFDIMQKYPKVMSALGFSAEESKESVNKLANGIDGLPTKLQDVVSTSQQMTAVTGNMDKSTNATLALNNAMLASGASTSDAQRGLQQYVQMLSTGAVDLQSWKTLQETMPVALTKTAEAMGYVGKSAHRDLYAALKSGEVTFDEFQNKLIELGTGTGILAEMAKTNSEGIATSFTNLRNSVANGLASVIESVNKLSESVTGKSIAKNLDGLKSAVKVTFAAVNKTIIASTPVVKAFVGIMGGLITTGKTLSPILMGVGAAFATWKTISAINTVIAKTDALMVAAGLSGKALTITTKANTTAFVADTLAKKGHTAAEIADMTASKANIASLAAQNGVITIRTALTGLMTGSIQLATVAEVAMTAATTALGTALKVATGPIGWVVAGIGALVAVGAGLVKWLNKETDASKKLGKEQDALKEKTNALKAASKTASANREESQQTIKSESLAYKDLVDQVVELNEKENKSTAEKKLLKDSVDQLNGSVSGLNLLYDAEGKQLSLTSEQMKARIDAYSQQETANKSQADLVDILKEQHDVEAQLEETNALRDEWNKKLDDGKVKTKEHTEAIEGLDKQEKSLKNTLSGLTEEQKTTQATLEESNAAVAAAVENGTMRQVISYQTLSDAQKEAVDGMKGKWQEYQEAATNMFDVLTDNQEMSVAQMQANLEENQRVISTWAQNIATLSARGIDEGLLAKMRDMGPEGAGYVAAMVNASDAELQNMGAVFANGYTVASDGFRTAWATDANGIDETVMGMVTQTKATLSNQIAAADFKSLGAEVPAGAASGISENADQVSDATSEMAGDASDSFAEELDINSPSRVFKEHGKYIDEGLILGIEDGKSAVGNAVSKLGDTVNDKGQEIINKFENIATKIPEAFDNLQSDMEQVGNYAMQGLTNGINNNSGQAISAAQSVANQVADTINSALDIHSPSRVTMESGEFATEGLEIGLLSRIRNLAASAKKVSQTVIDNLSNPRDYQMELGLVGSNKQTNLAYSGQDSSQQPLLVTVQSFLDGKVVASETAPYMATVLQKQQDKANNARGRRG